MGLDEIIALGRDHLVTIILAVVAIAFLAALAFTVSGKRRWRPWRRPMSATERRFRNVFAIMEVGRREALIAHYAKKHRCGREAAMQHALDHRDQEARSWR
jgi:hypothetical protein